MAQELTKAVNHDSFPRVSTKMNPTAESTMKKRISRSQGYIPKELRSNPTYRALHDDESAAAQYVRQQFIDPCLTIRQQDMLDGMQKHLRRTLSNAQRRVFAEVFQRVEQRLSSPKRGDGPNELTKKVVKEICGRIEAGAVQLSSNTFPMGGEVHGQEVTLIDAVQPGATSDFSEELSGVNGEHAVAPAGSTANANTGSLREISVRHSTVDRNQVSQAFGQVVYQKSSSQGPAQGSLQKLPETRTERLENRSLIPATRSIDDIPDITGD